MRYSLRQNPHRYVLYIFLEGQEPIIEIAWTTRQVIKILERYESREDFESISLVVED